MKQTSSKRQTIRARVVHVYIEYICLMFAWSCKRGINPQPDCLTLRDTDTRPVHRAVCLLANTRCAFTRRNGQAELINYFKYIDFSTKSQYVAKNVI